LFVNPTFTSHIAGLPTLESRRLLELLYEHATAPEQIVRWHWSEGDIAFWDNRSTLHYPVRDYGDAHRLMHRVTIRGDRPR
jgi:alpha-ketoglutarate-dependent taurine dioxygenase